jgi:hypothetical protein
MAPRRIPTGLGAVNEGPATAGYNASIMTMNVAKTGLALLILGLGGLAPLRTEAPAEARILEAALTDSRAYDKLTHLCDRIGHRFSGSDALERAVEWAAGEFGRDGIEHVWTERVLVPRWVRGPESARLLAPVERELAMLTLGGSVGTAAGGLTADVLVVDGFEELEAAGEAVRGKIVLYDKPMQAGFDTEAGYGTVVGLRARGASAAAKLGGAGMLLRSLGTADYRLPHTGSLRYEEDVPQIPAAAISAEDAGLIRRLVESGDAVRVRMDLGARYLPDRESANVVAELRGRERPDEIVLIGAHLDSWDVGDGAHDDGAGCVVVMEALRLLKRLNLVPRRTIRAVLFTNEENGLRGGRDYAERHGEELHVVAIESDTGGAAPLGFGVSAGPGGVELIEPIASRLESIGATRVFPRGGGADISPLRKLGVPVMSLVQDIEHYFDVHHTEADTLDKVARAELDRNVAAMTLMAYALAEQEATLPRLEPAE